MITLECAVSDAQKFLTKTDIKIFRQKPEISFVIKFEPFRLCHVFR